MKKDKDELKILMDEYARFVYKVTKKFPRNEVFGITSQLRRSTLSVILNYIEGYARINLTKSYTNFLINSYGSLKESKYLLYFSFLEKYLSKEDYKLGLELADNIGKMLWGLIKKMKSVNE